MRGFASQGQHRAAVLALELAEIEVVAQSRGTRPILLLDDVSSELDLERTTALLTFVREQEGQVFLTTTRPDLIDSSLFAAAAVVLLVSRDPLFTALIVVSAAGAVACARSLS